MVCSAILRYPQALQRRRLKLLECIGEHSRLSISQHCPAVGGEIIDQTHSLPAQMFDFTKEE